MTPFIAEIIGTFILMLLGNGVVANVLLNETKGNNSGWIVITTAWGLAVYVAVLIAGPVSGAHINPAVTLSLAIAGLFEWSQVPLYILAQFIGAMLGALCVYLFHKKHYDITEDVPTVRATFCNTPAIENTVSNLFSEIVGTFVLLLAVFYIAGPEFVSENGETAIIGLGSLGALPVALVVWSIGLSLGGTTGYAINPARDLGPRMVYALLPIKNKNANWKYSWIPVIGPLAGGALAAILYLQFS
ncbi:MAG: aquaporin [Alteromonas sp.]|nr:aquaporin [Alteromonas sp.]MAY22651.1 aquaporin [Flavobacteriaceae bacterium]|tara:strand:- start:72185 stop:72919 length:735 start_codon:yes stop_codon:yes gene_type:complete